MSTLVERAIRQTYRARHGYIAVPAEMSADDPDALWRVRSEIPDEYCKAAWRDLTQDVTHVCLLPFDHDGGHGWPRYDAADDLRAEQFDRLLIRDVDAMEIDD